MIDKDALQTVSFELDIPSATPGAEEWKISSQGNLPLGIKDAKNLLKAVDRIAQGNKLIISFDVPKWVEIGLKNGELRRVGGVIVTAEGHQIKWWLKEAKLSRVGQVAAIATIFIDVLSEILLNRKLKEIQVQLESIEDYSKAEYFSPLLDAHEDLRAALRMENPNERQAMLWKARDNFRTARGKSVILFNLRKGRIHQKLHEFANATFSNKGELEQIYKYLSEMFTLANTIVHCYQSEARIFEALSEPVEAERLRVECMNFELSLYEYANFVVHGSPSYEKLELVRRDNLDVENVNLKGFYPLHRNLGALSSKDGISPQRKGLFEGLKVSEQRIAIQYCEMAKTDT